MLGEERGWKVSGLDFGSTMPMPFAHLDRDTSSWRTCQGSLLEDSGEFCTTWPKQGTWDLGFAYELLTLERLMVASESSSLLPTPSAFESTPTPEYVEELQANLDDPFKRHSQRTLSRMVPALLPTPGSNDHTGAEGETRDARRESGPTGGPSLRDLPKLLPTPTVQDGENTAGPSQYERNLPHLLEDETRLLPTPQSADGAGGRNETAAMATLPLPTAVRLRGELTSRPFANGSESSDGPPLGQLTIGDA